MTGLNRVERVCLGVLVGSALVSAVGELSGTVGRWYVILAIVGLVLSSLLQGVLWLLLLFSERPLPLRSDIMMAVGAAVFFGLLAGVYVNANPDTFASLTEAQRVGIFSPPTTACLSVGLLCAGGALWARLRVASKRRGRPPA